MTAFDPIPLGQPIPETAHAVSASLPTMADVIGYEEKKPEVMSRMGSGYPRFVVHPFNRQLGTELSAELELAGHTVWLTCSANIAQALAVELGTAHVIIINHQGLHGIAHPDNATIAARAKTYLQNTGGFLSSREAEDHLVTRGSLPAATVETLHHSEPESVVKQTLLRAYPGTTNADIILAPSGMSAFRAAWRTLADLQASRGRTIWIQFGWLYLDTIAQLQRFSATPRDYVHLVDVTDLTALAATCAAAGDQLAGLVTEAPTNPLIQTADLPAIALIIHAHGGRTIIDPTLVSPFNVTVLPHADLVVNSLTKYAASDGDVIAGATIINPAGPDADWLREHVRQRSETLYPRDLARLAAQIGDYKSVVAQTNHNAAQVIAFLSDHPAIETLYFSLRPETRENYLKIARSEAHIGSMISFTVKGPLAPFYDNLTLPKGPSFGMKRTLICPFIYLAHYDLVTSPAGRAELHTSGIPIDLLRLSVGTEPAEQIIQALSTALDAASKN
jgi:cystathionine gamma-synthase